VQQTAGSQPRDCKEPVQTGTAARNSGPTERAAGTSEPGAANLNPTIGHAGPAADSAMHHALVALGFRELPRNPGRCGGRRGHDRHAESPATGAGARQ